MQTPTIRRLFALVLAVVATAAFEPHRTQAADASGTAALLSRVVVDQPTVLADLQAFVEPRIRRMPRLTSADAWRKEAERLRAEVLDRVVFRGEAARWRDARRQVVWLDSIEGGPGYTIRRLRYEAAPGLWIPALMYEPTPLEGKRAVALHVNGHDSVGKAAPYKQLRSINLAKRGMVVLNVEWLGMGQLRGAGYAHGRMNQLDLCGTSGLSVFYLAMQRGLDVLLEHKHAHPERVAVSGLSGGGWQTIILSSLDPRVTFANPVAGYSGTATRVRNNSDLGDSEQTPVDLSSIADYTHLTALLAPRAALLTYNDKDDCCFSSGHALPPLLEAAGPVYQLLGHQDRLRWHVNSDPGTHNFERDNREALYRAIGAEFFAGDSTFDAREIPSEAEVKTFEQLLVPLPENNADFNTLARALAQQLPRDAAIPADNDEVARLAWAKQRRAKLHEIVRAQQYDVQAEVTGAAGTGLATATYWRLRIGDAWTVSAVELTAPGRADAAETTLVLADGGRATASADIERLLAAGKRVLAVDPFGIGELRLEQRDYLWRLLASTVAERPLGIVTAQVGAIARWARDRPGGKPVDVLALGPRASVWALVAAAHEEQAIDEIESRDAWPSLREVIARNLDFADAPELFCFGLLEHFDVPQLTALCAPRAVRHQQTAQTQ